MYITKKLVPFHGHINKELSSHSCIVEKIKSYRFTAACLKNKELPSHSCMYVTFLAPNPSHLQTDPH